MAIINGIKKSLIVTSRGRGTVLAYKIMQVISGQEYIQQNQQSCITFKTNITTSDVVKVRAGQTSRKFRTLYSPSQIVWVTKSSVRFVETCLVISSFASKIYPK